MKKILALTVCVLMACAFMASCSAQPAPSAAPASEAPAATEAPASEAPASETPAATQDPAGVPSTLPELSEESAIPDAAVATGGGLQKIKDAGKLIMMTNATFPPYEYLNGADVAGADVDIAQMVADEIGVELEVVDMDFDGLPIALQNGKGDLVAAGMTITPERQEAVDFSIPYTDATQLIIVNKDDPKVSGPDDFEGKTIGVQLGTTGDIYIQYEIEDGANITVKQYKSNMDAAMDLINGKLDAIVLDEMPAKSIMSANDSLAVIEEPFTEEQYAMAVAKGNTELLQVVDQVLMKLVENKQVQPLIEQHAQNYADINQ